MALAPRGRLPGAGRPESNRACAFEKLEGERRHGEPTLMESFKSTLRAIRFLSIGDGQGKRGPERKSCVFGLFETWIIDCLSRKEGVDAYGTLSFHVEMDNKLRT